MEDDDSTGGSIADDDMASVVIDALEVGLERDIAASDIPFFSLSHHCPETRIRNYDECHHSALCPSFIRAWRMFWPKTL